jgi:hypothetical protein
MVCPSPENNPTASAHAFLELFSFCTMAAVIGRFIYRSVGRTSPVHVDLVSDAHQEMAKQSRLHSMDRSGAHATDWLNTGVIGNVRRLG